MTIRLEHSDCLEAIPRLVAEGVLCDAVVTDPPYLLKFMGKRWDDPGSFVERRPERSNRFDHVAGNHNATSSADLARTRRAEGVRGQTFHEEWARAVYTILRPGAFLVAFGGTRTYHRLVSAIEDAGFVIQDCVMWLYGSGFPKNRAQLKPAHEPICLAYKPGGKRTMQIDECRIHGDDAQGGEYKQKRLNPGASVNKTGDWKQDREYVGFRQPGRWPANVTHDGSAEVLAAFPDAGSSFRTSRNHQGGDFGWRAGNGLGFDDTGSAARFFYCSKANKHDRAGSKHPTVKPVNLIAWLVALVTPPGGTFLDPFAGSGTAAAAALKTGRNAILIEREAQYVADIQARIASYKDEDVPRQTTTKPRRKAPLLASSLTLESLPLFARPYDEAADLHGSYYAAIEEVGRRVKAGEPVPECLLSKRPTG